MVNKQTHIKRFQDAYRAKTGIDLPDDEAMDLFEKLVALVDVIYKPIPLIPWNQPQKPPLVL